MEMSEIISGGLCVLFVAVAAIVHVLEGMHLMEWLKKIPWAHRLSMNRGLLVVLGIVGICLLVEAIKQYPRSAASPQVIVQQPGQSPSPAPASGPITVTGDCNGANTGNNGTVNVDCGKATQKPGNK